MTRPHRDDILFSCLALAVFVIFTAACAAGRWYLAMWYLGHCGLSAACSAADAAIDYWWLVLLVLLLGAAWRLNRAYQARLRLRDGRRK